MGDKISRILVLSLFVSPLVAQFSRSRGAAIKKGGDVETFRETWRVLEPITRRALSIFPVVSSLKVDTSEYLTLDEGLASGAVRIAERGQLEGALHRRRDPGRVWGERSRFPEYDGASVNELALVNSSPRPLILLAGEVVSGGKQNRIIGVDLVVPPKSEPVPLTVFCVEHGRWTGASLGFRSAQTMAHPAIRLEAQAKKSQSGVWQSVSRAEGAFAAASPTANYQDVVTSPNAKSRVDKFVSSIQAEYEEELRQQLRGQNAVGVVVAINGRLVWSDVFPSGELFQKYWPKLLRSYVLEAEGLGSEIKSVPSSQEAEKFLRESRGRVNINVEPGVYRRTEISADAYQLEAIEALNEAVDSALLIHYNKMARN